MEEILMSKAANGVLKLWVGGFSDIKHDGLKIKNTNTDLYFPNLLFPHAKKSFK